MGKQYPWKEDYSLGVGAIDRQHQKLFELVNQIYALEDHPQIKEDLRNILYELSEYVQIHFNDEERWMHGLGYPGLEEHRRLHGKIVAQFSQLLTPPLRLDIVKTKMKVVAKKMLIDHILDEDMKIKAHINAAGPEPRKDEGVHDLA